MQLRFIDIICTTSAQWLTLTDVCNHHTKFAVPILCSIGTFNTIEEEEAKY